MLMKDKKGLIMGVANDRSIAWGIAKSIAKQGGQLAFTYQGEALKKRVLPLAQSVGSDILIPCDVTDSSSITKTFEILKNKWGKIDFLVHAIERSFATPMIKPFLSFINIAIILVYLVVVEADLFLLVLFFIYYL